MPIREADNNDRWQPFFQYVRAVEQGKSREASRLKATYNNHWWQYIKKELKDGIEHAKRRLELIGPEGNCHYTIPANKSAYYAEYSDKGRLLIHSRESMELCLHSPSIYDDDQNQFFPENYGRSERECLRQAINNNKQVLDTLKSSCCSSSCCFWSVAFLAVGTAVVASVCSPRP